MQIRYPDILDIDQIKDLWLLCFDDSEEFTNWFFSHRYSHENTLAVFDDVGNIEAALQLLPYNICLHGTKTRVSYIVGVSTYPEHRGKGHAKNLLYRALDILRERGEYISILLPFNYQFYRKYGWEICYEHMEYNTSPSNFHIQWKDKLVKLVKEAKIEDIELLDSCYSEFMSSYNGYIDRSYDDWLRRLRDVSISGGNTYLFQQKDSLGYISFANREGKTYIYEFAYTDTNAKNALLSFVSHGRENMNISWTAPPDDMSYMNMVDARGNIYRQPFVMGRIVDVAKAITSLSISESEDFELFMRVRDDFYKFNHANYMVTYRDENLRVSKDYNLKPDAQEPYVELDINTLTQLFWGYIGVDRAAREGTILYSSLSSLDILNRLFQKSINMIYEDY